MKVVLVTKNQGRYWARYPVARKAAVRSFLAAHKKTMYRKAGMPAHHTAGLPKALMPSLSPPASRGVTTRE